MGQNDINIMKNRPCGQKLWSFKVIQAFNETVSIKNNSVNIQRDKISTLSPAGSVSRPEFGFPIPTEKYDEQKKRRI